MKMIYTPSKIPIQLPLETSTTTGHAARPRGFLVLMDYAKKINTNFFEGQKKVILAIKSTNGSYRP
jgi:hypothetical protein